MGSGIGDGRSIRVPNTNKTHEPTEIQDLRGFVAKHGGKTIKGKANNDGSITVYASDKGVGLNFFRNAAEKQSTARNALISTIHSSYEPEIAEKVVDSLSRNEFQKDQYLQLDTIDRAIMMGDELLARKLDAQEHSGLGGSVPQPSVSADIDQPASQPIQQLGGRGGGGAQAADDNPSSALAGGQHSNMQSRDAIERAPSNSNEPSKDLANMDENQMHAVLDKLNNEDVPSPAKERERIGNAFLEQHFDAVFSKALKARANRDDSALGSELAGRYEDVSEKKLLRLDALDDHQLGLLGIDRGTAKARILEAFKNDDQDISTLDKKADNSNFTNQEVIAYQALASYFKEALDHSGKLDDLELPDPSSKPINHEDDNELDAASAPAAPAKKLSRKELREARNLNTLQIDFFMERLEKENANPNQKESFFDVIVAGARAPNNADKLGDLHDFAPQNALFPPPVTKKDARKAMRQALVHHYNDNPTKVLTSKDFAEMETVALEAMKGYIRFPEPPQ